MLRQTHAGRTRIASRLLALALPILCLALARPAAAQDATSLTATLAGLGCSSGKDANQFAVLSFNWGASNPVTVGSSGITSGKVSISSFNVRKSLDACSPALFGGAVNGTHFPSLTIVQLDKKNVPLMTVTLSEVIVESIQWSGEAGTAQIVESISFAFAKSCLQDGPSGAKLCYDSSTGKAQ